MARIGDKFNCLITPSTFLLSAPSLSSYLFTLVRLEKKIMLDVVSDSIELELSHETTRGIRLQKKIKTD